MQHLHTTHRHHRWYADGKQDLEGEIQSGIASLLARGLDVPAGSIQMLLKLDTALSMMQGYLTVIGHISGLGTASLSTAVDSALPRSLRIIVALRRWT